MTYEPEEYSTSLPPNEEDSEVLTADEQSAVEEFLSGDADPLETEDDVKYYKDSTYEIVSKVAYLIGVPKRIFENEHTPPKIEVFEKFEVNKTARIVRNLCRIRTAIERNFKHINDLMRLPSVTSSVLDYLPTDGIKQLADDGISLNFRSSVKLSQHIIDINRLISDRVNNCKNLFPTWLNWQYLKNIFVMPNGLTEAGTKAAANLYFPNISYYPYQMYINWQPKNEGNILYSDKKFVTLLYRWNKDEFLDYSKVSDAGSYVKGNIYDFISEAGKVVVVVDCENSDPYKLSAVLKNLDYTYTSKISSIILFDDVHTATAWRILDEVTDIPVEHMMIDRVKQSKSLVDITLTARTCTEFYRNNVDSFIIVSSDSDYWGLITSLPDAHFLVMIEHENCGPDLKNALENAGIFYCYIDDFYSGNAEDLKLIALMKEMYRYIGERVQLNINEMYEAALTATRVEMTDAEKKQFFDKHIRTVKLDIDDDGSVRLKLKM